MKLYKVLTEDRRSCHGGNATWEPGVWTPPRTVDPCETGYHLCRREDLVVWLGPAIWEAEGRGVCVKSTNKVVYSEARIIRRLTQWTPTVQSLFAADCAERGLQLYKQHYPNDARPRRAIEAARALPVGHPDRVAAAYAAYAADADDAAYAAYADAYAAVKAAYADERAWQTERLWQYLNEDD